MPTTHGMSNTPLYRLWWGMVSRCRHPKTRGYAQYGARGIRVCERWLEFENFYADMGERPAGATLDRLDNDKDYAPDNCKWADNKTQQRNRRDNVRVDWAGRTWILVDLCRHLGIRSTHLYRTMHRGMSLRQAIQHLHMLRSKHAEKQSAKTCLPS